MYATIFNTTSGTAKRSTGHDSDHGFCTVCGAVWPCSRARRDQLAAEATCAGH